MRLFEEAGILERHEFGDGRSRYEAASDAHHDHLIDVETGNVIEFVDDELELLQKRIAEKLGFRLVDHRMELYGVASTAAAEPARRLRAYRRLAGLLLLFASARRSTSLPGVWAFALAAPVPEWVVWGSGVDIRCEGAPATRGTLLLANHVQLARHPDLRRRDGLRLRRQGRSNHGFLGGSPTRTTPSTSTGPTGGRSTGRSPRWPRPQTRPAAGLISGRHGWRWRQAAAVQTIVAVGGAAARGRVIRQW